MECLSNLSEEKIIKFLFILLLGITLGSACDSQQNFIDISNSNSNSNEELTKQAKIFANLLLNTSQNLQVKELSGLCGCNPGGYEIQKTVPGDTIKWHLNWCGSPDSIVFQFDKKHKEASQYLIITPNSHLDSIYQITKKLFQKK